MNTINRAPKTKALQICPPPQRRFSVKWVKRFRLNFNNLYIFVGSTFRKLTVLSLGPHTLHVDFVETGFVGGRDFIFVRFSPVHSDIVSSTLFRFPNNIMKVIRIWESMCNTDFYTYVGLKMAGSVKLTTCSQMERQTEHLLHAYTSCTM